jgi:hypothetical protein
MILAGENVKKIYPWFLLESCIGVIVFSGRNDTRMKTESAPDLTVVIPVY